MTDETNLDTCNDDIFHSNSVRGALYFLNSGDYLFRWREEATYGSIIGRIRTKCLAAPDVNAAFSHNEIDSGWMPAGIRRYGYGPVGRWCVFSIPAGRVGITLLNPPITLSRESTQSASSLQEGGEKWLEICTPELVLLGMGKKYFLFAINGPFSPDQPVYHAPFPNVYDHGEICFGENHTPEIEPGNMDAAWRLFIDTPFNADLVNGKSVSGKDDVRTSLMRFARRRSYPVTDLIPYHNTIGEMIEYLIRG